MRQEPRGRAGYRAHRPESWRYSTAIVGASTGRLVATAQESAPWRAVAILLATWPDAARCNVRACRGTMRYRLVLADLEGGDPEVMSRVAFFAKRSAARPGNR